MSLTSFRIPLGFLIAGIFWALFSDHLISEITKEVSMDMRDIIRGANDFVFVAIVSIVLYFQIKKQQHKLISSEDQYRRLFELNPNPMWIFKRETLEFVKVNHAAVELYGYSMDEFLSMKVLDIRPPEEHQRLIEYVKMPHPGVRKAGTWKHLKKYGELLYISIVSYDLEFNGMPCSLVMANNITAMVLNEEKIKKQNTILHEIAWTNSHEVRRGLCSVISLIALLKDAISENERREYIHLLQQCTSDLDEVLKSTNRKVDKLENV